MYLVCISMKRNSCTHASVKTRPTQPSTTQKKYEEKGAKKINGDVKPENLISRPFPYKARSYRLLGEKSRPLNSQHFVREKVPWYNSNSKKCQSRRVKHYHRSNKLKYAHMPFLTFQIMYYGKKLCCFVGSGGRDLFSLYF